MSYPAPFASYRDILVKISLLTGVVLFNFLVPRIPKLWIVNFGHKRRTLRSRAVHKIFRYIGIALFSHGSAVWEG